jgi:hypothetical protein
MTTIGALVTRRWLLTTAMALVLTGCASGPPVDTRDETRSLVFGYFDMTDAPSKLEWVSLRKYDTTQKPGEWYGLAVRDGLFFHVGIGPGSYQVEKFGGMGGIPLLTRRPFEYDFGSKGRNGTAVRVREPGLYFLGAHQYVNHAGKGLFAPDKFEMKPVTTPTEKELLQRLVKELESDKALSGYTRQLGLARRRLAEL